MEFRKTLLGAASILALTAGVQQPAEASIPPTDLVGTGITHQGVAIASQGDPLFALMARTRGSLQPHVVEQALRDMFANPTKTVVDVIPNVLSGLAGLGASAETISRARDALIEIVSNAPDVSNDVREALLSSLQQAKPASFKIAQLRHHRIPQEIGQVGGGGAPGGASSDIRLKHNVMPLGRLANGLGLYRFCYLGSDLAYVGVMAQEVETIMPDAVVRGDDGYLRVYYDKLGMRMQTWEEWTSSGQTIPVSVH
jgi:Chaperone of endosialidase